MKFWNVVFGLLCAAWIVALYYVANPTSVWDWRVFAAFAQAILSAGAIYSAYWLQNKKREADRRQDEDDEASAAVYYSYLFENAFAGLVAGTRTGLVVPDDFKELVSAVAQSADNVAKVDVRLIRRPAARHALLLLQTDIGNSMTLVRRIAAVGGKTPLRRGYFNMRYLETFKSRSQLLEALGVPPEAKRQLRPKHQGKVKRAVNKMRKATVPVVQPQK